jgi:hypothetical protein
LLIERENDEKDKLNTAMEKSVKERKKKEMRTNDDDNEGKGSYLL